MRERRANLNPKSLLNYGAIGQYQLCLTLVFVDEISDLPCRSGALSSTWEEKPFCVEHWYQTWKASNDHPMMMESFLDVSCLLRIITICQQHPELPRSPIDMGNLDNPIGMQNSFGFLYSFLYDHFPTGESLSNSPHLLSSVF
jgi:hypothetical protein